MVRHRNRFFAKTERKPQPSLRGRLFYQVVQLCDPKGFFFERTFLVNMVATCLGFYSIIDELGYPVDSSSRCYLLEYTSFFVAWILELNQIESYINSMCYSRLTGAKYIPTLMNLMKKIFILAIHLVNFIGTKKIFIKN